MKKFLVAIFLLPLCAFAQLTSVTCVTGTSTPLYSFSSVPTGAVLYSGQSAPKGYPVFAVAGASNYWTSIASVESNSAVAIANCSPHGLSAINLSSIGTGSGQVSPLYLESPTPTLKGTGFSSTLSPLNALPPSGYKYWYDSTSPGSGWAIAVATNPTQTNISNEYAVLETNLPKGDVVMTVSGVDYMMPAGYVGSASTQIPAADFKYENATGTVSTVWDMATLFELAPGLNPIGDQPLPELPILLPAGSISLNKGDPVNSGYMVFVDNGNLYQVPESSLPIHYSEVDVNGVAYMVPNADVGTNLTYAPNLIMDQNLSGTIETGDASGYTADTGSYGDAGEDDPTYPY